MSPLPTLTPHGQWAMLTPRWRGGHWGLERVSRCLGSPSSGEQGLCGPEAGATPLQAVLVSSPSQPWLPFLPEKMQGRLAQMGHRGVLLCSSSCPLNQAPEHSQEGQPSSGSPAAAWGHLAASPERCQAPGARGSSGQPLGGLTEHRVQLNSTRGKISPKRDSFPGK